MTTRCVRRQLVARLHANHHGQRLLGLLRPERVRHEHQENTTWEVTDSGVPTAQDGYSVAYTGCDDSYKINQWNTTGSATGSNGIVPQSVDRHGFAFSNRPASKSIGP